MPRALLRFLAARRSVVWEHEVVGGCRLDLRRARDTPSGDGPAIVVVPGLALSGHYVLPLAAALAHRYPVWVPDLPGHAGRCAPGAALDMPSLADVVVGWMDTVGLADAVLVGNSMGCQVAVEAAARHPDRVSHVVLEGPTIDAEARSVLRHAGRILLAGRREPMSLGPLQVLDWSRNAPRTIVRTVRHTFEHRIERALPRVGCPALVVRGGRDPIVPQHWAERVTAGLPDASLVVVPDAGHALTYSQPRQLALLVEAFLAGAAAR